MLVKYAIVYFQWNIKPAFPTLLLKRHNEEEMWISWTIKIGCWIVVLNWINFSFLLQLISSNIISLSVVITPPSVLFILIHSCILFFPAMVFLQNSFVNKHKLRCTQNNWQFQGEISSINLKNSVNYKIFCYLGLLAKYIQRYY